MRREGETEERRRERNFIREGGGGGGNQPIIRPNNLIRIFSDFEGFSPPSLECELERNQSFLKHHKVVLLVFFFLHVNNY